LRGWGIDLKETQMPRTDVEELAHRSGDGLEVTLWWRPEDDSLLVVVDDARSGDLFQLDVDHRDAMDAFDHPYAYAAHRGVAFAAANKIAVHA
jgi:hypothetical protein